MMSDEELVARSRGGDLDSFNQLVLRWERPIYALAYRVIGREEEARDVAQETFLRAFRALSGFKGQAKFSSWLYRITLNLCRDWIRRERRTPIVQAPEGVDLVELAGEAVGTESIDELVSRKELGRAVARAMALLPDEQRTAIILKEYHGLTFQEIADLLDCPLSTVKTTVVSGIDGAAPATATGRRRCRTRAERESAQRCDWIIDDTLTWGRSPGIDQKRHCTMCDKELLLGYLYDELTPSDRQAFDRHLASCADCRDEVSGLRGTRTHLTSWAPPEPDLGFEIVRSARPAPARWWRTSPAWGLAAAAVLTLAAAAAIANIEIRVGGDGVVVQTGWNRTAAGAPAQTAAQATAVTATELGALQQRLEARVKDLEGQLVRQTSVVPVSANAGRMSEADLKFVRQLISDSEQRQQGELALRILQVNRDTEAARRADVDRLLVAYRQLQGNNFETSQRQRALEEHFVRVGLQR